MNYRRDTGSEAGITDNVSIGWGEASLERMFFREGSSTVLEQTISGNQFGCRESIN